MKLYLFLIALLFAFPFALAADPSDYQSLTMDVHLEDTFHVEASREGYFLKYLKANVSYVPLDDYRQDVLSLTTVPSSTGETERLFVWNEPSSNSLTFTMD